MDETIGLGFSSQHGGAVGGGTSSFVSAAKVDVNDKNNYSGHGMIGDNGTANNHSAASAPAMNNDPAGSQSASVVHIQQQQQQQQQQSQYPPSTLQQPLHSQLHIQPQSYSNIPMPAPIFPQPPPFPLPGHPAHATPQPSIYPPPNIATSNSIPATQQYPLPSFQPPPGMPPPAAVPYFPPPPNVAPMAPIPPPAAVMHHESIPPSSVASSIPANIQAQLTQQLMQQNEQTQQQQQQQNEQNNSLEKARAIAMRFHKESTDADITIDTTIPTNINYAQQRQEHFQKEKQKLRTFNLKNLEYVMKHEERELRKHVECMNQMTAYEERQQLQLQVQQQQQRERQLQLEQRKRQREQSGVLNEGGGGIGTMEQRRAERVRKRQHLDQPSGSANHNNGNGASTIKATLRTSLYLTNLPTDGSTTERTLQSLFCSYGRLDRVTMYRHRSTGELKGDGLIVFGRDAAEQYRAKNVGDVDLVEAVCVQMNGAELPCGTAIGVQPADMDYKKKSKNTTEQSTLQQTNSNGSHSAKPGNGTTMSPNLANTAPGDSKGGEETNDKDAVGGDEDDLDDFFASLE